MPSSAMILILMSNQLLLLYAAKNLESNVTRRDVLAKYPVVPAIGSLLSVAGLCGYQPDLQGSIASICSSFGGFLFALWIYWQQTQSDPNWAKVCLICHLAALPGAFAVLYLRDQHWVSCPNEIDYKSLTSKLDTHLEFSLDCTLPTCGSKFL